MFLIRLAVYFYLGLILRRPSLCKRTLFYLPDLRTFFATVLNELCYLLRLSRSFRITSVSVELSSRCNLNCILCARNKAMTRAQGDIDFDTFRAMVDNNPDVPHYVLVGWGEMMLNPIFFDCVDYLGKKNKRISLTTNGTVFTEKNIERIIESTISHITISVDGIDDVYESVRGYPYPKLESTIIRLSNRIKQTKKNIYLEINAVAYPNVVEQAKEMRRRLGPYVEDIRFSAYLEYNNPIKTNRTQPCREFWRGIIAVGYDGNVVPCCMDYNASMVLGNVREARLIKLWNGQKMKLLRKEHSKRLFKFRCATCYEAQSAGPERIDKKFD
ncbi:MAG: SPASM domain-containing protein [Deltaproteobacteria bacterium]|nr:SPASM domain-containing protein [Deltaproteobacteria bacterium]